MGFLGFNSINEAEAIGRREDRARFATKFAPQIASVLARQAEIKKTRPIMKINRPPMVGKYLKVADSVAVPIEKMVM